MMLVIMPDDEAYEHYSAPNGWRVSGERRAEGDERVRCTRMLGRAPRGSGPACPAHLPGRGTAPQKQSRRLHKRGDTNAGVSSLCRAADAKDPNRHGEQGPRQ